MQYLKLNELDALPFFTTEDVSRIMGLKKESSHVFCSRKVKAGLFLRLKKDFYLTTARWQRSSESGFFHIANFLQTPSYISCMSALSFTGVSTQVQRDWCESVSLKRSLTYTARDREFHYFKFMKNFYFGFGKIGDVFIARKEKALVDACHLTALGRYAFDADSLDLERLDRDVLQEMSAPFPKRTQNLVR